MKSGTIPDAEQSAPDPPYRANAFIALVLAFGGSKNRGYEARVSQSTHGNNSASGPQMGRLIDLRIPMTQSLLPNS